MIKSRKNAGFTLAETMLSMLILLLVSMIVANGVPVAKNAYEKVVVGANAKILLSTTIATLRDELATARDIEVGSDKKSVIYFNADRGYTSKLFLQTGDRSDENILIREYIEKDFINGGYIDDGTKVSEAYKKNNTTRNLISNAASNNNLYVSYDLIDYKNSIITFKNLAVYKKSDYEKNRPLASLSDVETEYDSDTEEDSNKEDNSDTEKDLEIEGLKIRILIPENNS